MVQFQEYSPNGKLLEVHHLPLIYTYTEWSQGLGKNLLKGSILSARTVFGLSIEIHVLYHGREDIDFLSWLIKKHVIIHRHMPEWIHVIERLRGTTDKNRSHLSSHSGNYLGTWQRIDIPLFINAEYALLLDADTIIHESFTLADFGLDITQGIAFSNEAIEDELKPLNAGVSLLNIPKLRRTYHNFLHFITNHAVENKGFLTAPNDQGAYLDFYENEVTFLPIKFNVKPYFTSRGNWNERKIVHYHGVKPHDIMNGLMGKRFEDFPEVLRSYLLVKVFGDESLYSICLSLRDFGIAMIQDKENLKEYCKYSFDGDKEVLAKITACMIFYEEIAQKSEGEDCLEVMKSLGFERHQSLHFSVS